MTEPGPLTFSLLGAFVAVLGPILGPYALIVFAACVGAVLAMSAQPMPSRWAAVRFVLLGAAIALLITGPLVWAAQLYLHIPGNVALVPVAFILGLKREGLVIVVNKAVDGLAAAVSAFTSSAGSRGGQ